MTHGAALQFDRHIGPLAGSYDDACGLALHRGQGARVGPLAVGLRQATDGRNVAGQLGDHVVGAGRHFVDREPAVNIGHGGQR